MAKKKTAKKAAKKKVTKKKTTAAKKKTAKKVTKKKTTAAKKKTAKKVAKKTTAAKKKTAKKAAKKVAKKTTAAKKKAAKKVTKKVAKKTAKKVAKKAAKKVTKKVAKKAAPKKVAKKVAPKKVAKKTTAAKKKAVNKTETATPKKASKKATKKSEVTEAENHEFDFEQEEVEQKLTKAEKKTITEEAREKISEGIADLNNEYSLKEIFQAIKTLEFYTSDTDECLARGCENPATTSGFCRFHYISSWKDIKKKQKILEEGQLQEYIENLVDKYPIKFIESLVSDLTDEKSFFAILKEMDIDADEESYEDIDEGDDDDQDIAFETKGTSSPRFDD